MTLQGRLQSPQRAGGGGERGCIFYCVQNLNRNNCAQCSPPPAHFVQTVGRCLSGYKIEGQRPIQMSLCVQLRGGHFNTSTANSAPKNCGCTNKLLETLGQMAPLLEMKNNLVPNVMFFNTPFMVGCSADPLGNNVAFCVGSASPPFSIPCAEK